MLVGAREDTALHLEDEFASSLWLRRSSSIFRIIQTCEMNLKFHH